MNDDESNQVLLFLHPNAAVLSTITTNSCCHLSLQHTNRCSRQWNSNKLQVDANLYWAEMLHIPILSLI